VKLDHGPTHPRLGRTRAHAPVAAGIACSGTSRRSTKQGTAFRRRICAAARRGWISRRRPHLCYRFCPSKSCAGSRFCFAPGSPKGIGQRVTLSAKRVTKSDNIGQHGTQLVGARCGIVRHRRCPNPRLPRSTPSAYSQRSDDRTCVVAPSMGCFGLLAHSAVRPALVIRSANAIACSVKPRYRCSAQNRVERIVQ
jgi:hypothetical protein